MQEARYNANIKLNLKGFDTQVTLREDENFGELLKRLQEIWQHMKPLRSLRRFLPQWHPYSLHPSPG
jgi:hypothetical protein